MDAAFDDEYQERMHAYRAALMAVRQFDGEDADLPEQADISAQLRLIEGGG
jgi:hypothetical protein